MLAMRGIRPPSVPSPTRLWPSILHVTPLRRASPAAFYYDSVSRTPNVDAKIRKNRLFFSIFSAPAPSPSQPDADNGLSTAVSPPLVIDEEHVLPVVTPLDSALGTPTPALDL